jgi:hypothetical protein
MCFSFAVSDIIFAMPFLIKPPTDHLENWRGPHFEKHWFRPAMALAISRRSLAADVRLRALVIPCGICGRQSGTGTDSSPSSSVFACQYHSTVALCSHLLGMNNRIVGGRTSETYTLSIDVNNSVIHNLRVSKNHTVLEDRSASTSNLLSH